MGDCFELRAPGVGNDLTKIEADTTQRIGIVSNVDIQKMCEEAKEVLGKTLLAEELR
jgi:salicylate hydroxylase